MSAMTKSMLDANKQSKDEPYPCEIFLFGSRARHQELPEPEPI